MTHANRRALLGVFLVLIGVFFLLENFGLLPMLPYWLFTWPMILIIIGVFNILAGNRQAAFVLLLIGSFFLLKDIFYLNLRDYWPVILIIIGVSFIFRQRAMKAFEDGSNKVDDNYFDSVNVFGGSNQRIVSNELLGGKATAIFGGAELDLRDSKAVEGATIEVFALFGGCDITVPPDWNIKLEVVPVLGGFSDKRTNIATAGGPTVVIKGMVMFGGGEIKN